MARDYTWCNVHVTYATLKAVRGFYSALGKVFKRSKDCSGVNWVSKWQWKSAVKLYLQRLYRHECFTGKYTVRKIHTKLHPGPEWRIFHILTSEDIVGIISRFCTVVCAISRKTLVSNIIKRKLHGGLKIWILFSRGKNNILLTREALVRKILFLPLENKIHIFAPPVERLRLWNTNVCLRKPKVQYSNSGNLEFLSGQNNKMINIKRSCKIYCDPFH